MEVSSLQLSRTFFMGNELKIPAFLTWSPCFSEVNPPDWTDKVPKMAHDSKHSPWYACKKKCDRSVAVFQMLAICLKSVLDSLNPKLFYFPKWPCRSGPSATSAWGWPCYHPSSRLRKWHLIPKFTPLPLKFICGAVIPLFLGSKLH